MTASLSGEFNLQVLTDTGAPAASYRLYTYAPSTTTQKAAYTDLAAAVPHTYTSDGLGGQYIALDARGELPAPLFLASGGYDLALKTPAGATVWTRRAYASDEMSAQLQTDLGDATTLLKGSGLIAFGPDVVYGLGTVGFKLREQRSIFDFLSSAQAADVISGTNALDLATPLQAARDWAAALGRPAAIVFPAFKYKASVFPNWNVSGLHIKTVGQPEWINTGTGAILRIDGSAGWVYSVHVDALLLTGNTTCAYGVQAVKAAHCTFGRIRVREILTYGFDAQLLVCCTFDTPTCSINADAGMVTKPTRGMNLGSFGGLASTANLIRNPIMEGMAQGLVFTEADFNVVHGGTAEACTTRGVNVSTLCKGTRIVNLACEANTTEDVLDQGSGTVIDGGYFTKKITQAGAVRPIVRGVRCQDITADATTVAPTYEDVSYSAFGAGGAITINAAVTKAARKRLFNVNTSAYLNWAGRENANPVSLFASITPGASPYTYTNSSDFAEQVIVRNNVGTVSRVDAIDTGANLSVAGGAQGLTAPGVYWVMPGEGLKVTYAGGAIEMIRLPR